LKTTIFHSLAETCWQNQGLSLHEFGPLRALIQCLDSYRYFICLIILGENSGVGGNLESNAIL
jgi:hypothetical protein